MVVRKGPDWEDLIDAVKEIKRKIEDVEESEEDKKEKLQETVKKSFWKTIKDSIPIY